MTTYSREFTRQNISTEDNLMRDVTPGIHLIPDILFKAPLARLLMQMSKKRKKTHNFKFEQFDDDIITNLIVPSAGVSSSTTAFTLAVTELGGVNIGDVLFNVTKSEQARVTAAVTGTGAGNLTCKVISGSGSVTWATTDSILNLGNSSIESDTDPGASMQLLTNRYNYCEDIVTSLVVSDWLNEQNTEDKVNRLKYLRKKKMIEHMLTLEKKFLFGNRTTSSSGDHFTTGGLMDGTVGASTIVDFEGAALDINSFEDSVLFPVWENGGSDTKMAFCSAEGIKAISRIYPSKDVSRETITPGMNKTVGIQVKRVIHQYGTLDLINHRLLNSTRYGDLLGRSIFIVDPAFIRVRDYGNMGGVKHHKNRQDNNEHGMAEIYRSICGLDLTRREVHGVAYNFTSPNA